MLDRESIGWLISDPGREAMAEAGLMDPTEESFLAVSQRLARRWPEALARAAVEQAILRRRGRAKFPRAGEMLFLREALEQSTGQRVAEYHARRLAGLGPRFDLGCGIGGDALALAAHGPVIAVDRDSLRLHVLRANARALGLGPQLQLLQGDLLRPGWRLPPMAGVFADPGRRRHGKRVHSSAAYEPPLDRLAGLATKVAGMGIKLSPGIDRREVDALGAEVEFVSEDGDLKECVLWFGATRTTASRATLLPGRHTLEGTEAPEQPASPILRYLYEPDPAVLRAGLVRRLAGQTGAAQIDPQLALLTADRLVASPFVVAHRVIDVLPFSEKTLRTELRRRGVGRVTLKKRGSAVDTEALGRRLRLTGEAQATVLLTRVLGKPLAIILEPLASKESTTHHLTGQGPATGIS